MWRLDPSAGCAPARLGYRLGWVQTLVSSTHSKEFESPPSFTLQASGTKGPRERGGTRNCNLALCTQPFCPSHHTDTHTYTHTHTDTQIHTHTHIHTLIHRCMHTQIHGYTETHTYTDTRTHRCTDTHAHPEMLHPLRRTSLQV